MTETTAGKAIDTSAVFRALREFIGKRPGLEYANYGDPVCYRAEMRSISADGRRAKQALREAESLQPANGEILADSFRAFSGRLEWIPYDPDDSYASKTTQLGRLEYTTGQYFPTEYRKAAASVLETYIAGWKRAYAAAHPREFVYATMTDVITANSQVGGHWFEKSTMRFFNTRIESRLIAGHRFITSEKGPDEVRRYTVREALPDGSIDTVGEFQQYETLREAKAVVLSGEVTSV